jgi:dipeptidyl aminopeptidase/acylaminoacyl peptidase
MKEQIGDPVTDKDQFVATSPVEQAAKIQAPLFLAYATDDFRVPIVHGEKMRAAMDAARKPYDWYVLSGEGHGMMLAESRVAYFRRVETFLATHLSDSRR